MFTVTINSRATFLKLSQIRFHGKQSGLHLLGRSDRKDDRNEGGIWYIWFLVLVSFVLTLSTTMTGDFLWHEFGPVPPVVLSIHSKKRAYL